MADRYLLESGTPDGYLLEDGTGVLLEEDYASAVLADTPVAYWKLGEASGNPQDSSGNAHHVTVVGGTPTYAQTGPVTGTTAIAFDGSTEYFTAPAGIDVADVFTLEAWVIPGATGASRGIICLSDGQYLRVLNTGALTLSQESVGILSTSTIVIPAGGWHHVVATKNGATVKLYIDGVDVTGTVTNQTHVSFAGLAHIGEAGSAVERFNGSIGQAAVYGSALSAAQVKAHYVAGLSGYAGTVMRDGPIAYYRLGDAVGASAAKDEIGTANATFQGSVGSPTRGVAGLLTGDANTAVTFTRSGSQYAYADGTAPAGGGSGTTIEAWVKFASLTAGQFRSIVRWWNPTPVTNERRFYYNVNAQVLQFNYYDGTTTQDDVSDTWVPTIGQTYHVVGVLNDSAETISFYVNGVLFGTRDVSANGTPVAIPGPNYLQIANGGGDYFDGTIDEVAVYTSALSAPEVLDHYNVGAGISAGPQTITLPLLDAAAALYAPTVIQDKFVTLPLLDANPTATIAFACGGEHTSEFTTSHWFSNTPGSGAVTVDTTHVDSSPNAIKITVDAYLRKIANTGQYFACRLRVWLPSGAVNGTRFLTVDDGVDRLLQYNTTAGKMQWYDGTDSTVAFPTDQWVTVDLEIDASANPHVARWRINGVAQTSASAAVAAGNVVQYYLGGGSGVGTDRWADNLAVSLTPGDYPIPAGTSGWSGSAEVWTPVGALFAPTVIQTVSTQTVTLGLLDAAPALYAPTLLGKNTVTLGLLDAAAATFAPTLLGKNTITVGLIDGVATLYAPTIIPDQFLTIPLLDGGAAVYAPTMTVGPVTVTLGLLDAGPALFSPTLIQDQFVVIPFLDAAPTLGPPTLAVGPVSVTVPLLDAAAALFAPTLVAKNTITLGLLDAGSALYAPTISQTVTLGLLDGAAALYAPTVIPDQFVTLGLLDGAAALFAPTLTPVGGATQTITVPLLDAGAATYAPSLSSTVTTPLLDAGPALFAPSIGQTVTVGLLDGAATLFSPTLTPKNTVTLGLLDGIATTFAPTIIPAQFLTIPLLDGAATPYAPSISTTVTLGLLGGASYADTVLVDAPVAYWPLGEASGNPQDSSGNGHNVTVVNGTPTYGVAGPVAGTTAVAFNGTTDSFTAPNDPGFDVGDVFTLEAWVIPGPFVGSRGVLCLGAGQYLRIINTGELTLNWAGTGIIVRSTILMPTTGWHHIVATKSGSTVKLYIDGVDRTGTVSNLTFTSFAGVLHIAEANGGIEKFNGSIGQPALYNSALSPTQIAAHYAAGTGGLFAPTLVAKNNITLGLLDAGPALFSPTVATRNAISLGLLDAAPALYAPSLAAKNSITLGLIDTVAALYDPSVLITGAQVFTVNAVVKRSIAGSFAVDAFVNRPVTSTFTVNAWLRKTQTGSFTLDAVVRRAQSSTFALDAVIKRTQAGAFTLNAVLRKSQAGSFLVDAWIKGATQTVSLGLLDAAPALYSPTLLGKNTISLGLLDAGPAVFAPTVSQTVVLSLLDAGAATFAPTLVATGVGASSFTVNAVIRRSIAGSFTADAVIKKTAASSFTVNAFVLRTASGSFTAQAVIRTTLASSFTASAVVKRTATATFSVDAVLNRTRTGSFTVGAWIAGGTVGAFTLSAVILRKASVTVPIDAVIKKTSSGSFTVAAFTQKTVAASFTTNAVVRATRTGGFTTDAVFLSHRTGSFTVAAVIRRARTSSFTLNAWIIGANPTFTVDAWIQGIGQAAFTLDANISARIGQGLGAIWSARTIAATTSATRIIGSTTRAATMGATTTAATFASTTTTVGGIAATGMKSYHPTHLASFAMDAEIA